MHNIIIIELESKNLGIENKTWDGVGRGEISSKLERNDSSDGTQNKAIK